MMLITWFYATYCSFGEQVQEDNTELLSQVHGRIPCHVYEGADAGSRTDCGLELSMCI